MVARDIGFNSKYKSASLFDIDQLRLQRDEKARILIIDEKVRMVLAHYIRSGESDDKGSQRGKYYACLGDYDRVMADTKDPSSCPACRVAEAGRDVPVSLPRRRFVLNIARYRTNSKGAVSVPVSLAHELWIFGDDKFNKLVDRAEEHGDLRARDLIVTCVAQQYQNYDIDVSAKVIAKQDKNAMEQYRDIKAKRPADVERLLATPFTYEQLEALVSDATPEIGMDDESTINDVSALLDEEKTPALEEPQQANDEVDFSDLLSS
jgi:hypothetical protein